MVDGRYVFPFSALHFDFDKAGWGSAWVIDKRSGFPAKLKIEVEYPLDADPRWHNLKVTKARLIKGRSGFDLYPTSVKIKDDKPNVDNDP